ncbi:type II toxin-antitoxin system HipA family toxin [Corynebacterium cystitidis]|uniref:Serine/threonine-protein kinase HipA n=1 Tax=Corynebacterium cystitidis DSM 20524 TaxID=1121357 RepID=A0A1H9VMU1_9CORY|nr:HipA domain-containing protein [Corynebacterium cystitidis]WJY82899.1 Serine/threonine-protein kinase HipA [Corynebacterium cystitidis DSM 20524]SES22861.1 serine/threonine-protein kinase HipA [Corynebacterium cystitidis DSM 20524]SNV69289.1 uncharacterized protein related to capsule biosynthesis enzyme [Corynebacterium cystitidis]
MTDLSRLRFIDSANVFKAGRLAAQLTRNDSGSVTFQYKESYSGPGVATTLPLGVDRSPAPNGALPPFFAGLLPEGHRLSVLQRAVKTSLDDEFTLLLAVGNDLPGDVQVLPEGQHPSDSVPSIDIGDPNVRFRDIVDLVDTVGIPGVQSKASASMINALVTSRNQHAILKIDPPEHPHLVFNEALHLTHAHNLGIPVSEATITHDRESIPGLVVKRFDRCTDGSTRALEDATQVLDLPPARKYNVDAAEVVKALAAKTKAPLIATRNLYLQFIFAWLTGNGDLHAKNVSIVQDATGDWHIAPVYDVPCTALYGDMTLALPVAGRTKNVRLRHWDEFADAIGLPHAAARSANTVAMRAAQAVNLETLPLSGSPLYAAERELRQRRSQLE